MKSFRNEPAQSNRFFNETSKHQLISNLNKEYRSHYREYFESIFAIQLMKQPELFPAVQKVSSVIAQLINMNKDTATKLVLKNANIRKDLLDPNLHGALSFEEDNNKLLDNMINILNDEKADINNKMIIHFVFMRYIFPVVKPSSGISKDTVSAITYLHDRARQLRENNDPKLNNYLGITKNSAFQKMIKDTSTLRIRPVDKYIPREESAYFSKYPATEIPFVAGPSGHTVVLLGGAISYCGLSDIEEMKQYVAACFAHLTSGGCHNFHEVYSAANELCGIPYEMNSYQVSLPESVVKSDRYKELCDQFPQFLEGTDKISCRF